MQNVIRYSAETIGPEERAKLEREAALAEGRSENEVDDGELSPALRRYCENTIARIRVSPEGQEGLRAFLEKRRPAWQTVDKKEPRP